MTYKDGVVEALKRLNGHAYLKDIYIVFEEIFDKPLVVSWKAVVRATLERSSSDSNVYDGVDDLFYSVEGIGNGHWGLRSFNQFTAIELTQEDDEFSEGKVLLKTHLTRERNNILINKAKKVFLEKHGKLYCEVCGFNFEEKYGDLGKDFIEAHHVKAVSSMKEDEKTKLEDLVMVCSNCHSMIHRRKPWLNKSQLKKLLK